MFIKLNNTQELYKKLRQTFVRNQSNQAQGILNSVNPPQTVESRRLICIDENKTN